MQKPSSQTLFKDIKALVESTRDEAIKTINSKMVEAYFLIGKMIIQFEQQGKSRAGYAAKTLAPLSDKLTKEFGRGFSVDNLENMRKF